MKFRNGFAILLATSLCWLVATLALAAPPQTGSSQTQPTPPSQTEKKKAKKVWTDDDFPSRPGTPSASAPAQGAASTSSPATRQPAAKTGEAAKGEETADPGADTVESLEKQLETLVKSRQSYEQQIQETRAKMRSASDDVRYQGYKDDLVALDVFIQRNEEDTATLQAKLAEARKRAKAGKPAKAAPAPPPQPE